MIIICTQREHGTHMINLPSGRGDLAFNCLYQVIVIALRHRRLLLGRPRQGKPHLWPENWWNSLSNQPLQSNGIGKNRELKRGFQVNPFWYRWLQIPICAFAGFQSPPNSTLFPHFLSHLIQHIDIIHIPFYRKPIKVLELYCKISPPCVDARPQNWYLGLEF